MRAFFKTLILHPLILLVRKIGVWMWCYLPRRKNIPIYSCHFREKAGITDYKSPLGHQHRTDISCHHASGRVQKIVI